MPPGVFQCIHSGVATQAAEINKIISLFPTGVKRISLLAGRNDLHYSRCLSNPLRMKTLKTTVGTKSNNPTTDVVMRFDFFRLRSLG